ncbi:non-heme ferritin [secondary endosymbiont of Ctenarytaina eucalypti]|uniref:Ferritin n=1 Tax=secondary endosymbiont of Ctenarytaina eucalypti TaxID=1199245 RepID=J3TG12_9ENTR|nr:non-heme ferritin [secondary endosymbiont of Ctenarytaina eucalypti]AFP85282.1 ferritin-like protein [secondary endosymbiont of Ctenarytaina eucalypti]
MLKKEMASALNAQLNLEFFSANLYLQMSAWCNEKGFEGAGQFFKTKFSEEMDHMRRLFDYFNDTGTMPILGAIDAPPVGFSSLGELISLAYKHEQLITHKINELVHLAMTLQDYSTFHFLQWYIAEQHEEEKMFRSILEKLALVNIDANGLFFIDRELKKLNNHDGTF